MNSLFPVTIFGLLLVASGSLPKKKPWAYAKPLTVADYGVLNNGSLEAYRRIAEKNQHDNVAAAPIDTLIGLFFAYENSDNILTEFFHTFEPERIIWDSREKYIEIQRPDMINLLEMGIGMLYTIRSRHDNNLDRPQIISDETGILYFWSLKNLVLHVEQWYRDRNIDVQLNKTDFVKREVAIYFQADHFRHTWQQHRRCVMQWRFHQTKNTFRDDVKYTRMISNLRYGELPELNAKYIVVPWTVHEGIAGDTELYVILPNTVDGLTELETRITDSEIQRITHETGTSRVEVILPEILVTRKYHTIPLMRRIPETPDPALSFDLIAVTKFDLFRASAYSCHLSPEFENEAKSDLHRFIADHPFLVLFVEKTASEEKFLIAGMLAYRSVEQADNLSNKLI